MAALFIRITVGFIIYAVAELIAIVVWIVHPTFVTMLIAWLGLIVGSTVLLAAVVANKFRRDS